MAEGDNNSVYQLVRAGGTVPGEYPLLGLALGSCSASRCMRKGRRPLGPVGG